jgi:hypothetical protein
MQTTLRHVAAACTLALALSAAACSADLPTTASSGTIGVRRESGVGFGSGNSRSVAPNGPKYVVAVDSLASTATRRGGVGFGSGN